MLHAVLTQFSAHLGLLINYGFARWIENWQSVRFVICACGKSRRKAAKEEMFGIIFNKQSLRCLRCLDCNLFQLLENPQSSITVDQWKNFSSLLFFWYDFSAGNFYHSVGWNWKGSSFFYLSTTINFRNVSAWTLISAGLETMRKPKIILSSFEDISADSNSRLSIEWFLINNKKKPIRVWG